MSIDKDNYRVSPNEAMESESFDSRPLHKGSSLIDQKQKAMRSHASGSGLGKSPLQYRDSSENRKVEVSNTWDNRKSTAYPSKDYSKSSAGSRVAPTRTSSSLSSYHFNTNRSTLNKSKRKDSQRVRKVDSEKKLHMSSVPKTYKNKPLKQQSYHPKTKQYLKTSGIAKKNVSSTHLRNPSQTGTYKKLY